MGELRYLCKKVLIFLTAVILILFIPPVYVFAEDDPGSAAFPSIDELFNGRNDSPYLTVYRNNYYLDIKDGSMFNLSDSFGSAINGVANVCFSIQENVGYFIVTIFYYSFEIDLYQMFSGIVGTFVEEMKTGLFDQLAIFCIALLGIFFAIKVIQDQRTQVWVAIFQTAIIVAIAIYFFTSPTAALKQVDAASKEISRIVLTGTYKATNEGNTPDSAVMAAANEIWLIYVHEPWQMLEFGNISMAKTYEKQILTLSSSSDERKALIKQLAADKQHFTPSWGAKRLGLILLYFIPMLIILVIIIVLCALMLIYQFLTILFTMLGVFVFIMALIPFIGIRVIQSWFSKIIGFAGIKVVVSFCLGIIMALISTIFTQAQGYGWIMTLFLELLIVVSIIWKKDALFEAFTTLRLAPANPGAVNKQLRRDTNVESKLRDYANNIGFSRGRYRSRAPDEAGDEEEADEPGRSKTGNYKNSSSRSQNNYNAGRHYSGGGYQGAGELATEGFYHELQEEKTNDSDNFRQLMKKAEEILEKQYEISKAASEEKAEKTHKQPEYSSFVNKVDTREKLGAPRFDQREIISVAQELERVTKAGGKPEDLYNSDVLKPGKEVESPKSVIDIVINGQKETVDREESYKIVVEDSAKDYTEEFNREHGKNYDPKFMEEIIKRYGMQNTKEMLDRMKDIQNRTGKIENPAGYLTQSLKNNARDRANLRSRGGEDGEAEQ